MKSRVPKIAAPVPVKPCAGSRIASRVESRVESPAESPAASRAKGQALVEYLLMLSVAITLVTIIQQGLKSSIFQLWTSFTQDIVAACPGCPINGNSPGLNYGGR